MSDEKVWGVHSVRYSQMPASGVPATRTALRRQAHQEVEGGRGALVAEALVQEDRHQREDRLAVDVVLAVAPPRRSRCAPGRAPS